MRKRIMALVLAVATGISMFGCSKSTETSSKAGGTEEKTKITVWAWDPNFNIAVMNEAKAIYEKENTNVEIEVVDYSREDIEQKLHTLLTAGTKIDLPEIVLIEDYSVQKYLQSYPGAFEDLTGKIPHDDFADYKVEIMTLDKKVYGVPFDTGVAGYFYRLDIIEEAGFKEEDLQNITWDRFIEIGKVVKEKTGKPMLSMELNNFSPRLWLSSAGSWYIDPEEKPYITENKALKDAIRIHKELLDSGVAIVDSGWVDLLRGFNSGEVAGVASGVWMTPSVMQEESQKGLWRVAPIPRMDDKTGTNAGNSGGSSWYVLSNSKGKNEAVDFLKTTYTNKELYQTILDKYGALGTYIPSMNGEAYKKQVEFFGGQEIYSDFSKWMIEIPAINYGIYTSETEAVLGTAFNDVMNGKDIDEALKAAEDQIKMQIE